MRLVDGFGAACVIAALVAVATLLGRPESLSGHVTVVDGDSLRLGERNLRLLGIDAPELHQTCTRDGRAWLCGEAARDEMRRLAAAGEIRCAISGRDRYGRSLARCDAGGADIGARMVARGLAVAYGAYEDEERTARDRRLGLWAGPFERPADWRRLHPRVSTPGANASR